MTKSVLAIHDLSGIGNTSLMVIIPLMYRFGIKVCALPTALLSANTCFEGYRGIDTSGFIEDSIIHYHKLGLKFSAVYSGFLGNPGQVDTVLKAISSLSDDDALIVVDPVMADGGELYECYDASMVEAMRRLVGKADLITPNYTEACLLAEIDPLAAPTRQCLRDLCEKLHGLGPKEVAITSVTDQSGGCDILYSSAEGDFRIFTCEYIPCFYTGTGDIFSALMVINRLAGIAPQIAIPKVADFISSAIKLSQKRNQDGAWGVVLEEIISSYEL
jgi:pyridoxine kinase